MGLSSLTHSADPICALQACMKGFEVVALEFVVGEVVVLTNTTGNFMIITLVLMKMLKNIAFAGVIGHFDIKIDMNKLENMPGIKVEIIIPQVDRFVFPVGHGVIVLASGRLLYLGCATGHPSFVLPCSFTNQLLGKLVLLKIGRRTKVTRMRPFLLRVFSERELLIPISVKSKPDGILEASWLPLYFCCMFL